MLFFLRSCNMNYSLLFLTLFLGFLAVGQDTNKRESIKINGFPIAYYAPETRLAFGALGVCTFSMKNDDSLTRRSNVNLGFAFTQNKQLLIYLPYQLYLKQDRMRVFGEIGWYNYTYFFFGIGNNAVEKEAYNVRFPRLRLNGYYRFNRHFFAGLRYGFDAYSHFSFQGNGFLVSSNNLGSNSSINSSLGIGALYDTRDSQFYPKSGTFAEMSVVGESSWLGSSFRLLRTQADWSSYYRIGKRAVLAWNVNYHGVSGEVPFYALPMLGGGKRLRGLFEGQFRDRQTIQAQLEWRQEFFKYWGIHAFAGVGIMGSSPKTAFQQGARPAGGLGLRYQLNKKEHINIRLDLGVSGEGVLPYFTLSEAF